MTVSTLFRTSYPAYRTAPKPATSNVKEHRPWISCPRCIGGSMYPENNHEYACIQCGYHSYQSKVSKNMDAEVTPVSPP